MRHHFFVKPEPPYADPVHRPLRQLNPAELAQVARNKASVYEHLPELLPFIKDLHDAGMIDGWRRVEKVTLLKEVGHGTA